MKLHEWLGQKRGRQAALAAHLGLKQPQIADWVSGKKPVPLDHCPLIQAFTEGAVTCEELRQDKTEYFAMIRTQGAPTTSVADLAPSPTAAISGAESDRRDPLSVNPFPDLDRRAAPVRS